MKEDKPKSNVKAIVNSGFKSYLKETLAEDTEPTEKRVKLTLCYLSIVNSISKELIFLNELYNSDLLLDNVEKPTNLNEFAKYFGR